MFLPSWAVSLPRLQCIQGLAKPLNDLSPFHFLLMLLVSWEDGKPLVLALPQCCPMLAFPNLWVWGSLGLSRSGSWPSPPSLHLSQESDTYLWQKT